MNTNNGAESLNKILKYSFLPRKKSLTLSRTVSLVVEDFLPVSYQKYLFQNYKQSSQYRSYKSFVPEYLHGRPHSTILHCLERKTKALKYSVSDTSVIDLQSGKFTLKGSKSENHKVDFGIENAEHMPSCTCPDWTQWQLPCKHFFAIFNLYPQWGWNQLPAEYLKSAYLSMDTNALDSNFCDQSQVEPMPVDSQIPAAEQHNVVDELPTEKVCVVCVCDIHVHNT